MKRTIELYGRLRDAGLGSSVEIDAEPKARAADVLAAVRSALGDRADLIAGAVLATDTTVLNSEETVPDEGRLAALPPVCGG